MYLTKRLICLNQPFYRYIPVKSLERANVAVVIQGTSQTLYLAKEDRNRA